MDELAAAGASVFGTRDQTDEGFGILQLVEAGSLVDLGLFQTADSDAVDPLPYRLTGRYDSLQPIPRVHGTEESQDSALPDTDELATEGDDVARPAHAHPTSTAGAQDQDFSHKLIEAQQNSDEETLFPSCSEADDGSAHVPISPAEQGHDSRDLRVAEQISDSEDLFPSGSEAEIDDSETPAPAASPGPVEKGHDIDKNTLSLSREEAGDASQESWARVQFTGHAFGSPRYYGDPDSDSQSESSLSDMDLGNSFGLYNV